MLQTVSYLEGAGLNQNLLAQLVLQVQKDFQMSVSTEIYFYGKTAIELVQEVEGELKKIITSSSVSKLTSLLYRVDVSESEVEAIIDDDIDLYVDKMVYAILKREFQKVCIRNTFL